MSLRPSEFVTRQVRVTPYPHEDAGWIIANTGDEVCLFSSDYPHVEGGRNPIKRFEASMADRRHQRGAEAALLLRQFRRPDGRGPGARAEASGMKTYTTLLTERTGPVHKITTNRPEVLNAQSRILLEELDDAFLRAVDDRRRCGSSSWPAPASISRPATISAARRRWRTRRRRRSSPASRASTGACGSASSRTPCAGATCPSRPSPRSRATASWAA